LRSAGDDRGSARPRLCSRGHRRVARAPSASGGSGLRGEGRPPDRSRAGCGMTARSVGANLVDLALAAAIAALPAHLLALGWSASLLPSRGFPEGSIDGPSTATRRGVLVVMVAAVFVVLRWTLERGGQGPGKCLWSLRVKEGKVVEDQDGLVPLERLGVFAGRFARPLLLGLASV